MNYRLNIRLIANEKFHAIALGAGTVLSETGGISASSVLLSFGATNVSIVGTVISEAG